MDTWKTSLQLTPGAAKLLLLDREGDERLKALLPLPAQHPRALSTLLEGLALWSGAPLRVALVAGARWGPTDAGSLFGLEAWPAESPLLHFEDEIPLGRRRTLAGVGDFRQLRLIHRRWS